jgi:hypothetical protein
MTSLVQRSTTAGLRARHWLAARVWRQLADVRGQGTVEYVGIVIVVGVLLVALKAGVGDSGHAIASKISKSVADAIQNVMEHGTSSKG